MNSAATPDEWIDRCAKRLRDLAPDMDIDDEALRIFAEWMVELPYYSRHEPEAAAEMHRR